MIRANELRIWNLIKYTGGEVCEVDHRDIKWISEKPKDFNKCKQPILLTEEWLKKFGFEYWEDNNYVMYLLKGILLVDPNTNKCQLRPDKFEPRYALHFSIQYAHQLQNLYFALTGEELTTK